MTPDILEVLQRKETLRECRDGGFIPAVLYGKGFEEGYKTKVNQRDLEQVLREQGENATLWIKVGEDKNYAIIKEVQKDLLRSEILHVDFQAIDQDEEIEVNVPVIFEGREQLETGELILQIILSEVDVTGKAMDIPESLSVNVSKLEHDSKVTVADLVLPEGMKIAQDPEETLAVVTVPKEETEEETPAEPEVIGETDSEE